MKKQIKLLMTAASLIAGMNAYAQIDDVQPIPTYPDSAQMLDTRKPDAMHQYQNDSMPNKKTNPTMDQRNNKMNENEGLKKDSLRSDPNKTNNKNKNIPKAVPPDSLHR